MENKRRTLEDYINIRWTLISRQKQYQLSGSSGLCSTFEHNLSYFLSLSTRKGVLLQDPYTLVTVSNVPMISTIRLRLRSGLRTSKPAGAAAVVLRGRSMEHPFTWCQSQSALFIAINSYLSLCQLLSLNMSWEVLDLWDERLWVDTRSLILVIGMSLLMMEQSVK